MSQPKKHPLPPPRYEDDQLVFRIESDRADHWWANLDLYHRLLRLDWWKFLGLSAAFYLAVNSAFAVLYLLGGDCIANAAPGSFLDALAFSVQTFATIGYGYFYPKTSYAQSVVILESFVGLLSAAASTGLVFAKFSRPAAKVAFCERATIHKRNGLPCLTIRMANDRGNHVAEAHVTLSLLKEGTTLEGQRIRRFSDLKLERDYNPMFSLTWTLVHPIDPDSPLHGVTAENLHEKMTVLVVVLSGMDDTYAQTVHARKLYEPNDLAFGVRFVDMLDRDPDGVTIVHRRRLSDVEPCPSGSLTE